MRLSARNQLAGTVKSVNEGAAIANVELASTASAWSPRSPLRPPASSAFTRASRSPPSSRPPTLSSPPPTESRRRQSARYRICRFYVKKLMGVASFP
jgi:hypothetical protein